MKTRFRVINEFKAWAAVSGQRRVFEPDDEVLSELGQLDEIIAIEADQVSYFVNRSTFEDCCISSDLEREI
jgi:hypothetical protein